MKKLVQNPLPTTQLLPLTWMCIRKTVEYDLVPPTQDLVEMKKKYMKNEGQRRIYISLSNILILSKNYRQKNTPEDASKLLVYKCRCVCVYIFLGLFV